MEYIAMFDIIRVNVCINLQRFTLIFLNVCGFFSSFIDHMLSKSEISVQLAQLIQNPSNNN